MSQALTIEKLRKIVDSMKPNAIAPRVVESDTEAKAMTEKDLCGKVWSAGEKYYLCGENGFI